MTSELGGIVEKLLVHCETERAAALQAALKDYNDSFAAGNLEKEHAQFDIRIRLLALLSHLSNRQDEIKSE